MRISFFKPNKPKTFGFKPRYYSEEKERIDQLKAKHEGSKKERKSARREFLHLRWQAKRHNEKKRINFTFIFTALILGALACWVIFS